MFFLDFLFFCVICFCSTSPMITFIPVAFVVIAGWISIQWVYSNIGIDLLWIDISLKLLIYTYAHTSWNITQSWKRNEIAPYTECIFSKGLTCWQMNLKRTEQIFILTNRTWDPHSPRLCPQWESANFYSSTSWCTHAKSLQSFPTLCDPMDSSPPGSSVHGIL